MLKSYEFNARDGRKTKIEVVTNSGDLDQNSARRILIESFISEYKKYLQPCDVDKKLKCWFVSEGQDSVEQYYSDYFDHELSDFENNNLYWIEARIDNNLVGWATFEKKKSLANSCYMNLLIVDPVIAHSGVGSELVRAAYKLPLMKNIKSINLLLRKANEGGKVFYSKLGFKATPSFTRDNFVDNSLLEGWTLELDNAN